MPLPRCPAALVTCVLLLASAQASAQADPAREEGFLISCPQSIGDTLLATPAAEAFRAGEAAPVSTFELRFTDSVPPEAKEAIAFAASIWEVYLRSDVPVIVDVDWRDRDDDRLLASAGPSTLFRDFPGAVPDTWYPVALAEAIVGEGLNEPGGPDVDIVVNAEAAWYFGTDADPPRDLTDLATVTLHELGHGLGFISSADTLRDVELVLGFSGRFIVYDRFLESRGRSLGDTAAFDNPSALLLAAVTGDDLVFAGPTVLDRNGGEPAPVFSPADFDVGSSVSHFDETVYPPGDREALMTPGLARGEAIHQPGPITLGLLADLGWDVRADLTRAEPPSSLGTLAEAGAQLVPNPLRGERLRAMALPGPPDAPVVVTDVAGRAVARAEAHQLSGAGIDVAALPPGLYVVLVRGVGVGRFVRS